MALLLLENLAHTDVLRILNGQFGCDFEEDDLTIENTCCTEHTLTARKTLPVISVKQLSVLVVNYFTTAPVHRM